MRFADLLAEIGRAGFEAALMARKSSEMALRDALKVNLDDPPEGIITDEYVEYAFRRIMLRMPGPTLAEDKGDLLSIPLWGMLTGGNLDLDTLKATIEADVDLGSMASPKGEDTVPANSLKLEMRRGLTKKSSAVKIEMEFKMGDPPEIVEQLRDKLVVAFKDALKEIPIAPVSGAQVETEAE